MDITWTKHKNIVNKNYLQKKVHSLALLSCLSYNKLFANKIKKKKHVLFYTANAIFAVRCEISVQVYNAPMF